MKIKELIEELQKLDPELFVLVFNSNTCFHEELMKEDISDTEGCNSVVLER